MCPALSSPKAGCSPLHLTHTHTHTHTRTHARTHALPQTERTRSACSGRGSKPRAMCKAPHYLCLEPSTASWGPCLSLGTTTTALRPWTSPICSGPQSPHRQRGQPKGSRLRALPDKRAKGHPPPSGFPTVGRVVQPPVCLRLHLLTVHSFFKRPSFNLFN